MKRAGGSGRREAIPDDERPEEQRATEKQERERERENLSLLSFSLTFYATNEKKGREREKGREHAAPNNERTEQKERIYEK